VTMTLIDLLAAGSRLESDMLRYFGAVMPPAAHNLLVTTLQEVRQGQAGAQVSLGLLVTLLSSTSGMVAIIEGLNTAYDVREVRSWWKRRVVALVLTLGMSLFGIVSLSILLYGTLASVPVAANGGPFAARLCPCLPLRPERPPAELALDRTGSGRSLPSLASGLLRAANLPALFRRLPALLRIIGGIDRADDLAVPGGYCDPAWGRDRLHPGTGGCQAWGSGGEAFR
jgi:hypothetical protein